jgi:hypothetical protein
MGMLLAGKILSTSVWNYYTKKQDFRLTRL